LQFTLASAQLAYNQQAVRYEQTKAGATVDELAVAQMQVEVAQANYEAAVKKANLNDEQLVVARVSLDKAALSLQKAQSDYDKAVSNRQTDLTTQAVALQQAKLDYAAAQANYNLQVANINDTSVRSAAASLLSAKANLLKLQNSPTMQELQIAEAQLGQAQLTLQQAQYKLRDMQLIAPLDGIVTQVNVDRFSVVGATIQAMQIADLNQLRITVNLSEVDIAKVKVGQVVNISFDAITELPQLTGTVEQIALVGTTTQGVVNYPVVVALPAMEANLVKTGMTANVAIVVDKRENVLLVPNRAVKTQNRQKVVQLQTATGTAQTVIQLGLQNDSQSEVLSGLKEGDTVIIQTTTTSSTQNRNAGGPPPFGP
jgi:HlyD family secretion protein